jgi:DNA-binding transcriptional LysR family regulator
VEIRDLEYFAVVAAHGNVTRASEALELSPGALSKSLRRLERALDARLVKRTPKGIELTSVGQTLLGHVQRLRTSMDDVVREAADLSRGTAGHLRIGAGPAVCEELPPVYAAMLRRGAKATVSITEGDNEFMVPMLRRGELDLIVNYMPPGDYGGLVHEPLYQDPWVVCARAGHRLAGRKRIALEDLAHERWALSSQTVYSQQWLLRAFEEHGLPAPRVVVETRSLVLRMRTWASTDLLGFCSRRRLRQAAQELPIVALAVPALAWTRSVDLLRRDLGYLAPAARRFIELLKKS